MSKNFWLVCIMMNAFSVCAHGFLMLVAPDWSSAFFLVVNGWCWHYANREYSIELRRERS